MRGIDGLVYGPRARKPPVIDWGGLREGQRFRCQVTVKFHRVLRADVLA
jgi:hypothetical protein